MTARKGSAVKRKTKTGEIVEKPLHGSAKYSPALCGVARIACSKGYTDGEVAELLGINDRTLRKWKNLYPEFEAAMIRGTTEANDAIERTLFKKASGYTEKIETVTPAGKKVETIKTYEPDMGAIKFWLTHKKPDEYTPVKEVKQSLDFGDTFLKFLERVEEDGKARVEARKQLLIDKDGATDIDGDGEAIEA